MMNNTDGNQAEVIGFGEKDELMNRADIIPNMLIPTAQMWKVKTAAPYVTNSEIELDPGEPIAHVELTCGHEFDWYEGDDCLTCPICDKTIVW